MTALTIALDGQLAWEEHGHLPLIPAVYFIFDKHELYYIGRTQWLRQRIARHHYRKQCDDMANLQIGWVSVPEGFRKLKPFEIQLIYHCKPLWNREEYEHPRPSIQFRSPISQGQGVLLEPLQDPMTDTKEMVK